MLYLDSPILFINNLQIHRDFQNPNQFYYFPAAPRIHTDEASGKPALQLVKYARDVTDNPAMPPGTKEQIGGGFLVMTADIGVDDEVLQDTRNRLAAYASDSVLLAPVPFHTGTVELMALGAKGGERQEQGSDIFVQKVFGTTKPSLFGDNLALFGAHLSQEGITLVEDSFRHGGGLIGVVYSLTYAGIRPALQVKAKVDFERVYNRFEAQLGFQYATVGANIEATLEFLREQGVIDIEITQYDIDNESVQQMRRDAMALIKNEIIAKMFKPSLQVPTSQTRQNPLEQAIRLSRDLSRPPPASGGDRQSAAPRPTQASEGDRGPQSMDRQAGSSGGGSPAQGGGGPGFALTFSLKFLHQEERKTVEFDFRVSQAVNRSASPQGSLRALLDEGVDLDEHIRAVNLDDAFFSELGAEIGVTGQWKRLGVQKMVVNASYQPDPEGEVIHTDGWTFADSEGASKSFNVLLDRDNPVRQYKYKTEVFLRDDPNVDAKDRVLVRESTTEQRELIIHPANEFEPMIVTVEPSNLDWRKVRQIDVSLRYEDADNAFVAEQRFQFKETDVGAKLWIVYPVDPSKRRYQVTYAYHLNDDNSSYFQSEPFETDEEGLSVAGPFRGARKIRLIPAVDKEDVREVTAEVVFEQGGYRFYRQHTFEGGAFGSEQVEIPTPDPNPALDTYQVRWSLLKRNFDSVEFDWETHREPRVVLHDGEHGVEEVTLVFVPTPQEVGLTRVLVQFESLAPEGAVVDTDRVLVDADAREAKTDLLIKRGTPLRYKYTLTKLNGAERETVGPVESEAREEFAFL